jgi:transposase
LIGIEAGMATHYVARELLALGHDVRQVPPAYAKPFRQGHKNDFRDAYAIAEAVLRPSTRCVPVKTDDQLDLQALHRVRSRLVGQRTAVINQIRSFLLERGIAEHTPLGRYSVDNRSRNLPDNIPLSCNGRQSCSWNANNWSLCSLRSFYLPATNENVQSVGHRGRVASSAGER